MSWDQLFELGREANELHPSIDAVWVPGGFSFSMKVLYLIFFLIFQYLPACAIDFSLAVIGKKNWAVEQQKTIFNSLDSLKSFTHNSWDWEVFNFELLYQIVSLDERCVSVSSLRSESQVFLFF
jgi:Male sterility protein